MRALGRDDFGDRVDEPRIDPAELMNFLARDAQPQRVGQVVDALAVGQSRAARGRLPIAASCAQPGNAALEAPRADLQRAQRLLQRFLEGAADRHHLADRFHLRAEFVDRAAKFLEGEARNLGDHVIDGRLEAGRRHRA